MDFPLRLPILAEYLCYVVLFWIGFGTVVGLLARLIFPGREPSGPLGTVLIGVMGSVIGPIVVESVCGLQGFHPVSPLGFVSALGGAAVVLVTYRFFLLVAADHVGDAVEPGDDFSAAEPPVVDPASTHYYEYSPPVPR